MEFLPRDKRQREKSTKLRNEPTRQERHLWYDFLRNYPIQWNRQRVIGEYIVDFICVKAKLIVELDGGQHYTQDGLSQYDRRRTEFLTENGLFVLRFTNLEVDQNFSGVCQRIDTVVQERLAIPTALRAEPL